MFCRASRARVHACVLVARVFLNGRTVTRQPRRRLFIKQLLEIVEARPSEILVNQYHSPFCSHAESVQGVLESEHGQLFLVKNLKFYLDKNF